MQRQTDGKSGGYGGLSESLSAILFFSPFFSFFSFFAQRQDQDSGAGPGLWSRTRTQRQILCARTLPPGLCSRTPSDSRTLEQDSGAGLCSGRTLQQDSAAARPGLSAAGPGLSAARPGLSAARPGLSAARPGLSAARPGLSAARLCRQDSPGLSRTLQDSPGLSRILQDSQGFARIRSGRILLAAGLCSSRTLQQDSAAAGLCSSRTLQQQDSAARILQDLPGFARILSGSARCSLDSSLPLCCLLLQAILLRIIYLM